jgi:YYY domain-containing protein
MGLPFFGLVIALSSAIAATARAGLRLRAWLLAGLMGAALGLVRTVHTWDFPAAVLIAAAGTTLGQLIAPGRWQRRFWDGAGQLVLMAAVLTIAFAPYTANFEVFTSGVIRSHHTTEPQQYMAQFGIFLLIGLAFLAVRYYEELDLRDVNPGSNLLLATVAGRYELTALLVFLAGFTAFTWRFEVTVIGLSAILVAYALNLLWLEWRRRDLDLGRILATLAFVLALSIAAGVDVVTVKNDIERMNTVFKFGLQAWQLFALAAAYAVWYVWARLSTEYQVPGTDRGAPRYSVPGTRYLRWVGAGGLAFLLLSGSIYLWSGTRVRQEARFADLDPTLDGLAFLGADPVYVEDMANPDPADDAPLQLSDDLPLIEWLRKNVEGTPVIVEAVSPIYHWSGRFSEYTGLPDVIGWDWHQTQQRWDYGGLVAQRRSDTERFWKTTSSREAAEYLRKYKVSYVVVGTEETAMYPAGLSKLTTMPALDEVYRQGDYAIYRVDQRALPTPQVVQSP